MAEVKVVPAPVRADPPRRGVGVLPGVRGTLTVLVAVGEAEGVWVAEGVTVEDGVRLGVAVREADAVGVVSSRARLAATPPACAMAESR